MPPAHERVSGAVREARERLREAGIASADAEARALVSHAAGGQRSLVSITRLPEDFDACLAAALERRVAREPLQLILGRAPFRHVSLEVRPGVFIPRPETEVAIDVVHEWWGAYRAHAEAPLRAIDACTGSGTLAASLLSEFPTARVVAFDASERAVDLASANLARIAREYASAHTPGRSACPPAATPGAVDARFAVHHAHVGPTDEDLAALHTLLLGSDPGARADLLVANPPYIPADAVPRDREVTDYDPREALYGGGADGLDVPRAVVALAARTLAPGGLLVMEHADVQGAATREIARQIGGFTGVRTVRDLTGTDRFLVAERAPLPGARESTATEDARTAGQGSSDECEESERMSA
ncbi:MAG: HemK/PrmC family methyltransferase [Dermabacter sp.]|nr:HemK/PrmC family methyltransferase [Dermabacter sp.]